MLSNLQIAPIQRSDNALVAAMIRGVFDEYGAPTEGTVYVDPTTDSLSEVFKHEKSILWVAKKEDEVLGCCGIFPTQGLPQDCAELVKFYICQQARGIGLGRRLLSQCFTSAIDFGYRQLYIESLPAFAKAVSIYEKQGFRYLEKPLGNSGHSGCSIWMLKDLSKKD